jgi:hypothetical protein
MAAIKLEDLPVAALLQELRNRESRDASPSARLSEDLRGFGDDSILAVLRDSQKLIYGIDDRSEVFQLSPGPDLDDADSVVALFRAAAVADNGDGTSTLSTVNFGRQHNLCSSERFREQPTGAFCSGFLVAPDIVATAGHCVNADNVGDVRFVFGFRMRDAETAQTVIRDGEIYRGVAVIGHQLVGNGPDWALVRIDRPSATIASPASGAREGSAIQRPSTSSGIPPGCRIRRRGGRARECARRLFVANPTYGGNSGSPVFNSETHEVEGPSAARPISCAAALARCRSCAYHGLPRRGLHAGDRVRQPVPEPPTRRGPRPSPESRSRSRDRAERCRTARLPTTLSASLRGPCRASPTTPARR